MALVMLLYNSIGRFFVLFSGFLKNMDIFLFSLQAALVKARQVLKPRLKNTRQDGLPAFGCSSQFAKNS